MYTFRSHMHLLRSRYGMTNSKILKMVVDFPKLLGIVHLEEGKIVILVCLISRYHHSFVCTYLYIELIKMESALLRIGISNETKFVSKLIFTSPRVVVQDIEKKFQFLTKKYYVWDVKKCIYEYPRILTMRTDVIEKRINEIDAIFKPYNLCANDMINSQPSILNCNPHNMRKKLESLCTYLPTCKLIRILFVLAKHIIIFN